jgi:D-alanine-D-alanine ligase
MIVQTRKKELKRKNTRAPRVSADPIRKLKIWVLYPYLETQDPNLQHYYDFNQSLQEYTAVFKELDADWIWQPVTMLNYKEVISTIKRKSGKKVPLVFNLCDGDEVNGTPGVSIIYELEKNKLIYTGSDAHYYNITTSKIPMKKAFDTYGVSNAKWEIIDGSEDSVKGLCKKVGAPLIIKPAVSGGSMGVSVKNVVYTDKELLQRIKEIKQGYRGWNLLADGLIVEQFITGPEFTTLIVGSSSEPGKCIVYPAVERIFHESLPEEEKFLSFDRLWEIYEDEKPMPGNENFYNYHRPDAALMKDLEKITLDAYVAVGGKGYGRLDIRMDASTGKLYMLEVNAQCGLSDDEDYTSIGAILRYAEKSFTQLIKEIIEDAFTRRNLII